MSHVHVVSDRKSLAMGTAWEPEVEMVTRDDLIESLSAIEHERWADWQQWVHGQCRGIPDMLDCHFDAGSLVIPDALVQRWQRQIATPYGELSEGEKQSDREQVARYWPLIVDFVAEWIEDFHLTGGEQKPDAVFVNTDVLARKWREEMGA